MCPHLGSGHKSSFINFFTLHATTTLYKWV